MSLSHLDLKLLHLIELKPMISVQELAKRTGISWITANRHLEDLRNKRVLSNPIAICNPASLGLERYVAMVQTSSEYQMESLEFVCDVHPYTRYRARFYGPCTGLFTQFDIPPTGAKLLKDFFSKLQKLGLCDQVLFRKSTGYRISTKTNLEYFDSQKMTWNYEWGKWAKEIGSASKDLSEIPMRKKTVKLSFAQVDLEILREITANARISQADLQKKMALSQSTVNRKVITLRKKFIESIRAQIDRSRFDVTSTKLLYCRTVPKSVAVQIYNSLKLKSAPPFPLSIDLLERGNIVLWGRMPPSHEHQLFYTLWRYLPNLQVFTMDTIGKHSCMYWFFPKNYDTETQQWRVDEEWIVNTPLSIIEKKIMGKNI